MKILVLLLCGAMVQEPPGAERVQVEPIAVSQIVGALVRDLGADRYDVRENASQALRKIGLAALPALEKAAESDDPEVRTRAQDILQDLRLGISPDWPAEMVLLVRHYEKLQAPERQNALRRIAQTLGERAVPFLLGRLASSDVQEARAALGYLQSGMTPESAQKILELLKEPAIAYEKQLLAYAQARSGLAAEALKVLAEGVASPEVRDQVIEAGAARVADLVRDRRYAEAAEEAAKFRAAAATDPRFPYLEAESLSALGKDAQARELREKALALNPQSEAPHFTAAELLLELGRRRQAAAEIDRILAIPPADGVYDMNALLRMGGIYADSGMFEKGAESYSAALEMIAKARAAGQGVALAGGSEESLRARVRELQYKARTYPAAVAEIEDALPEDHLRIALRVAVKDGQQEAYRRALRDAQATLTMSIEPAGLRLGDLGGFSLRYDPQKRHLELLLNNTPCCKPAPLDLKGPQATIAIHNLDTTYLYRIDTGTGQADRTARFEKDYIVTFQPGIKVAAMTDVTVKINGQRYDWKKLLEGVSFDTLPKQLDVVLEGTRPDGARVTSQARIRAKEEGAPVEEDESDAESQPASGRSPSTRPAEKTPATAPASRPALF